MEGNLTIRLALCSNGVEVVASSETAVAVDVGSHLDVENPYADSDSTLSAAAQFTAPTNIIDRIE